MAVLPTRPQAPSRGAHNGRKRCLWFWKGPVGGPGAGLPGRRPRAAAAPASADPGREGRCPRATRLRPAGRGRKVASRPDSIFILF